MNGLENCEIESVPETLFVEKFHVGQIHLMNGETGGHEGVVYGIVLVPIEGERATYGLAGETAWRLTLQLVMQIYATLTPPGKAKFLLNLMSIVSELDSDA